jgi:hypothetical protein
MPETPPEKKKPGRPKGLGRVPGSGRKKGTPNKSVAATRERIQAESDPIGFLMRVARGLKFVPPPPAAKQDKTAAYPTSEQRVHAATVLARKIQPDMKALEVAGDASAPLTVRINL